MRATHLKLAALIAEVDYVRSTAGDAREQPVLRLQEQAGIDNITIFPRAMAAFGTVIPDLPGTT